MRLTASELAIGYGRHVIASNIDLAVESGDVHCLLGPNGCGKTTLFRTLLRLTPPLGGQVAIDGRDLARLSPRQIAAKLAYVPQNHAPPFPFTVFDVVLMGRLSRQGLFAAPTTQDRSQALDALQRVGMAGLARDDYSRLSAGQRQLVLIARALAQDAGILVLDEPTSSLDYGNQVKIVGEITRLAGSGVGLILSTHNPDHAFAVASQVTLIDEGRILASGPPEAVLTPAALSSMYGVAIDVRASPGGPPICVPSYPDSRRPRV